MNDLEEMVMHSREAALADNGEENGAACMPDILPCDTVAINRIFELNNAIARYINDPQLNRRKLAFMLTWARELLEQLDLLDTMLIYET